MGVKWMTKAYPNLRHVIDCCGLSWFTVQQKFQEACPESLPLVELINGPHVFTDGEKAELRVILNFYEQSDNWLFSRI